MKEVLRIINLLSSTTKTNEKLKILKDNKDNKLLKKVLYYTYSDKQYGFSEARLRKLIDEYTPQFRSTFNDGFSMLDTLAGSNINSNLINQTLEFLLAESDEELRGLWFKILVKDLACGISNKTIEKVFPGLLPKWEVMRPSPIDGVNIKQGTEFSLSLKENGQRATYRNGIIKSRQNEIFEGLNHIIKDIDTLKAMLPEFKDYVFDGELIRNNIDNIDDNENFRLTCSILSDENADKSPIVFRLFDMLPREEFDNGQSKDKYFKRKSNLAKVEQAIKEHNLESLDIVMFLYQGKDQNKINEELERWDSQGYEGLVLNLDKPYVCKKTKNVLKVKQFREADVRIVGWYLGKSGANLGKFGGFTVDYKGTHTNIGGGYSKELREHYSQHADEYIGRVMQIRFKDESMNSKTGKINIQFGGYVCIREEGKEPSYN